MPTSQFPALPTTDKTALPTVCKSPLNVETLAGSMRWSLLAVLFITATSSLSAQPAYKFEVESTTASTLCGADAFFEAFEFSIKIGKNSPEPAILTEGFSMSLFALYPPLALLEGITMDLYDVTPIGPLAGLDPEFFLVDTASANFNGTPARRLTIDATYGLAPLGFSSAGDSVVSLVLLWDPASARPECDLEQTNSMTVDLSWDQGLTLGGPPPNSVTIGGIQQPVELVDGSIAIGWNFPSFVRGDCDGVNSNSSLTDVLFLLIYLFADGPEPGCIDACDLLVDGTLDMNDATYLLNYYFLGGLPPSAPFPECGEAITGVSCESPSNSCDN